MNLGKILGSISPGFGLISGKGLFGSDIAQGAMGSMSPLYGMLAKKGLFGKMEDGNLGGAVGGGSGGLDINSLLAHLFGNAMK